VLALTLCVLGVVWPQQEARLLSKYKATAVQDGPWRKYVPDPKQQGFWAAAVPHEFVLHTSYGVMHGKKGDYVLKNFADGNTDTPRDGASPFSPLSSRLQSLTMTACVCGLVWCRAVWVVDRKLFGRTYTKMMTQTDIGAISAFLKLSGAGEAEQQLQQQQQQA
jgi:hypothetical protein